MSDYYQRTHRFDFEANTDENGNITGPHGTVYNTKAGAMYYAQAKLCGCGDPEGVYRFMMDILSTDRDNSNILDFAEIESIIKNNTDIAAQFILHCMGNMDLIEHGGSVRGSWKTPRGEQFIEVGPLDDYAEG